MLDNKEKYTTIGIDLIAQIWPTLCLCVIFHSIRFAAYASVRTAQTIEAFLQRR